MCAWMEHAPRRRAWQPVLLLLLLLRRLLLLLLLVLLLLMPPPSQLPLLAGFSNPNPAEVNSAGA